MAESDNILTKLHDLLVYVIPQINKFPRDQRFVLGDRTSNPDFRYYLPRIPFRPSPRSVSGGGG